MSEPSESRPSVSRVGPGASTTYGSGRTPSTASRTADAAVAKDRVRERGLAGGSSSAVGSVTGASSTIRLKMGRPPLNHGAAQPRRRSTVTPHPGAAHRGGRPDQRHGGAGRTERLNVLPADASATERVSSTRLLEQHRQAPHVRPAREPAGRAELVG